MEITILYQDILSAMKASESKQSISDDLISLAQTW